ncbi:MAG: glycoside hydrolase family 30 protein [Bacteroidota bacterium]
MPVSLSRMIRKVKKSCPLFYLAIVLLHINCKKPDATDKNNDDTTGVQVSWWLTKADQSVLLAKQTTGIAFSGIAQPGGNIIDVDSTKTFQEMDGFGYTLTEGSAYLINRLDASVRNKLLRELFGNDENGIAVSYLRVGLGATDLSTRVYSYNDLPAGETDVNLIKFSLAQDTIDVIPVLKQILAINPSIKIMASPWSAPAWMKDNNSSIGGRLLEQYYTVYARYFIKYIQQMKAVNISIDAITIQNEPLHGGNNPSMLMNAAEQANFIKYHLGPAFQQNNISTKIILYDHNCDRPDYPIGILNDPAVKALVNGTAFHLYSGDIAAMSAVKEAHPDKDLYFTEQWTGAKGAFGGDFKWHIKNIVIGSVRNWSRVALNWNLANDESYRPHTPGGCTECKGAITLDGSSIQRNVSYYVIAHASKFVSPGSVRILSSQTGTLFSVAFLRKDGTKVLIVLNDSDKARGFHIRSNGKYAKAELPVGSAATYTW